MFFQFQCHVERIASWFVTIRLNQSHDHRRFGHPSANLIPVLTKRSYWRAGGRGHWRTVWRRLTNSLSRFGDKESGGSRKGDQIQLVVPAWERCSRRTHGLGRAGESANYFHHYQPVKLPCHLCVNLASCLPLPSMVFCGNLLAMENRHFREVAKIIR